MTKTWLFEWQAGTSETLRSLTPTRVLVNSRWKHVTTLVLMEALNRCFKDVATRWFPLFIHTIINFIISAQAWLLLWGLSGSGLSFPSAYLCWWFCPSTRNHTQKQTGGWLGTWYEMEDISFPWCEAFRPFVHCAPGSENANRNKTWKDGLTSALVPSWVNSWPCL